MTYSMHPDLLIERASDMSTQALLFALHDIRETLPHAEAVDQCYGSTGAYELLVQRKAYRAELKNRRAKR